MFLNELEKKINIYPQSFFKKNYKCFKIWHNKNRNLQTKTRKNQLTWNTDKSKTAIETIKLNVAAAREIVLGGMHSPVKSKRKKTVKNMRVDFLLDSLCGLCDFWLGEKINRKRTPLQWEITIIKLMLWNSR